jgi:enoyl-CoA hydratase/carnithine racemase
VDNVLVERSGGIATVTIDRPRRKNAVDEPTWGELAEAANALARDPEIRCVVLTGSGGDFCSGADLSGQSPAADVHQLEKMRRVNLAIRAFHDLPQPTIARVRGVAVGAGMNLALCCDLVIAAEDARFSEIFAKRGLSIDGGGSWILPRLVGMHKAKELALLADIIDAQEALRIGLVNRVVAVEQLDAVVGELAARLAAGPPIALAMTKRMLNRSFEVSLEQALEDEGQSQTVNFATADTAEAIMAFVEKREPRFHGR